jgi:hypothetical protein
VLGQHRSTRRKVPRGADDEQALTDDIIALAKQYGRYGYRRMTALLRSAEWTVNRISINFVFEKMTRGPASLNGHRLVHFVGREVPGSESALIEHISSSFLKQAKVIDDDFLIDAGARFGIDRPRHKIVFRITSNVSFRHSAASFSIGPTSQIGRGCVETGFLAAGRAIVGVFCVDAIGMAELVPWGQKCHFCI